MKLKNTTLLLLLAFSLTAFAQEETLLAKIPNSAKACVVALIQNSVQSGLSISWSCDSSREEWELPFSDSMPESSSAIMNLMLGKGFKFVGLSDVPFNNIKLQLFFIRD